MRSLVFIVAFIYSAISYLIFLAVNNTSDEIIDEKFHLRQGKYYCLGMFDVWDEKITTLPGLYLASALVLPRKFCTTFSLRMVSLISSIVNLLVMINICKIKRKNQQLSSTFEALNIALLPPLYFFAHIYYTDVLSVLTVMTLYLFWLRENHGLAAIFGFLSILVRQTNVVWVAMILGISALKELRKVFEKKELNFNNIFSTDLHQYWLIAKSLLLQLWSYLLVLCAFVIFVLYNGSIVVGDKSAHVASLHLPQIFYFSLFVLFFGPFIVLSEYLSVFNLVRRQWAYITALVIFGMVIVKYNSLTHPYLLADNRHYTFYIWNRFYGKFSTFKYFMVPIYVLIMLSVERSIRKISDEFKLMFSISLFVVLCFQQLLEVRYFVIPFILLRLKISVRPTFLILEFIYYLIINGLTFYVFFTKEVHWDDYEKVQRIIW